MTLRDNYLAIIYGGLVKNKTVKQIHKELYDLTFKTGKKGLPTDKVMLNNAIKTTNRVKKELTATPIAVINSTPIADLVFLSLNRLQSDKKLTQNIYKMTNEQESELKEQIIANEIQHNRQLVDPKVFYLASAHNDSATDHKSYQGKYYIDENWRNIVEDKELKARIETFIRVHNVKTMQWVIGKPVWFITRPNCRHYFKAIKTSDVLNISKEKLIKNNKLHRQVGDRQYLQTLDSGVGTKKRKLAGEKRNAQLMIDKYEERLAYHNQLYSTFKSSLVKSAIEKDKMLINKWKDYEKSL